MRAANAYKVAKRTKGEGTPYLHHWLQCASSGVILLFTAAGDAFKKAAELHLNLDTKHEAASNYTEAAQVLKREEPRGWWH